MDKNSRSYHYGGSRKIVFDQESRFQKAEKIYLILQEKYPHNLKDAVVLDIGCSAGLIDYWLADKVHHIYGIDIDLDTMSAAKDIEKKATNFTFVYAGGDRLPFRNASFDIVLSNIMYNLLSPEAQQMMFEEIYRSLKPQGICYFAAPNKLLPVHGKYKLPFLDALPIQAGRMYVNLFSPVKEPYNEYPKTLFGLKNMVKHYFTYEDITLEIIDNSDRYKLLSTTNKLVRIFLRIFARIFYLFMPNYVFVLQKKTSLKL